MNKHSQKLIASFLFVSLLLLPLTATNSTTHINLDYSQTNYSNTTIPSDILPALEFFKINFPVDANGNDNRNNDFDGSCSSDDDCEGSTSYVKGGEEKNLMDYTPPTNYGKYFFVQNNEVVFQAHCAGALTSKCAYPRCELRETPNGTNDLWRFEDEHILNATFKVTHLPDVKPEVCMLQIKGNDSNSTSGTEEAFRLDYREDKQKMHVTINEASNPENENIIPYVLGQTLTARLYVNNKQIKIMLKNETTGDVWNTEYTSNYDYGYFKAGCYTQSSIWECKNGVGDEAPDAYGEVRFSKLSLTDEDPPTEPNDSDIWLEAECETIGSGWEKKSDSNASEGAYVVAKAGNQSKDTAPTSASSRIRFTFQGNLEVGKNWKLKARVRALSDSDDSFWVRINEATWINWSGNVKTGSQYKWQTLRGEGSDDFHKFSLKNGQNTIDFAYRENGARLDKILLTTQNTTIFDGSQTDATNCDGGNNCSTSISHSNSVVNSGTYHAINISSKGIIASNSTVIYKAAQTIQLEAGFHAQQGSAFTAKIETCPNSNIAEEENYLFFFTQNQMDEVFIQEFPTLKLSPNPSSSMVQIDYYIPESESANIRIYDINGQLINSFRALDAVSGKHQLSYDISELPAGIYIFTLQTSSGNVSSKLVKN